MTLNAVDKELLQGMFDHMLKTETETMTSVVQPSKHIIGFENSTNERTEYTITIEKKVL